MIRLDYETTSACDIKFGAWRYAADPTCRILMFAVANCDDTPLLWRCDEPKSKESIAAKQLLARKHDGIYAFNAGFEAAVSHYRLLADVGIDAPDIERFRCTQLLARRASIPVSLATAAQFLKLPVDKDAKGKALIGIFSDQRKLVTLKRGKETRKSASPILETPVPWDWHLTVAGESVTVREAWDMFCSYCRQDVVVEREVHHALTPFEPPTLDHDGYIFTNHLNALGAPVNLPAAAHAQSILDEHQDKLVKRFQRITGYMPSQTARVLEWLQGHGYKAKDLQAATMRDHLESPPLSATGKEALEIRSNLSFAAIKKVKAILDSACPDNTLKGMFTFYGASATGRWTSSGVQLQNVRKPTIENPDLAYLDICEKTDSEIFEMVHGNPYEAVASCVRNFIQPHHGRMLACDLSNIESRVAALMAEQMDLLATYREGRDAYKELASKVFRVPVDKVTKDQRFVGKVGNLSLVFATGAKTFHETCAAWGMPIEKKLACATVRTFRQENAMFPKTWRAVEAAAVKAINAPGQWFKANPFISFASTKKAPFFRLMMKLPSGRCLCYPLPMVQRTVKKHTDYETGETREWESDDITYWGQLKMSTQWGRVGTHGGVLFQNSVQATARDVMLHGCLAADARGYRIFSIIHDEVLAYDDHDDGIAGLEECMTSLPEWLPADFPLAASGEVCDYYTKS